MTLDGAGALVFPVRSHAPAVYALSFEEGGRSHEHIGQCESQRRRFDGYRNRTAPILCRVLADGGSVRLLRVVRPALRSESGEAVRLDLRDERCRLLVKAVAIEASAADEVLTTRR